MKISRKRQLFFVLASVIGYGSVITYVLFNCFELQAIATVPRQQSLTIDRPLPSLPGELALDEIQKENILKINQVFDQKIHQILSLEQLQQFTAAIANGLGLLPALDTLSLTTKQKSELRLALKSAQSQVEQVLTPEQLEYVNERMKVKGERRKDN